MWLCIQHQDQDVVGGSEETPAVLGLDTHICFYGGFEVGRARWHKEYPLRKGAS